MFHCLPLQGKGGCIGKGQLPRSQADRAGYENPREDCGRPHQTVGVNPRFPVWLRPRCTTDAIVVVRQLQEKYLAANMRLYMAFVDLGKAFDRVPRKVIWWALRKLGVEEWIVQQSRVRVGEGYSEEFEVKVDVHQGSVLSPLLFIIVLEAYYKSSALGSPGKTSILMTLLSSLNHLRNVSGGS